VCINDEIDNLIGSGKIPLFTYPVYTHFDGEHSLKHEVFETEENVLFERGIHGFVVHASILHGDAPLSEGVGPVVSLSLCDVPFAGEVIGKAVPLLTLRDRVATPLGILLGEHLPVVAEL